MVDRGPRGARGGARPGLSTRLEPGCRRRRGRRWDGCWLNAYLQSVSSPIVYAAGDAGRQKGRR